MTMTKEGLERQLNDLHPADQLVMQAIIDGLVAIQGEGGDAANTFQSYCEGATRYHEPENWRTAAVADFVLRHLARRLAAS